MRHRLGRRFGPAVEVWLDALPPVLSELAERWRLQLESLIRRGTVSVVIRCRTADGSRAVLKLSPDRRRILAESAALARWQTAHVPAVLEVDEDAGALLIEAIEPGTALDESDVYPNIERVAALMRSLHTSALPDPSYASVAQRVVYLFDSGLKDYERRPDLAAVIPHELYERGRRLALRLAGEPARPVLLHGDLTPVNILDGGEARGLVAIDPAPCVGDPAFDAVDLVLWRADDVDTITTRAERLAAPVGVDAERVVAWCAAFAAMSALELAATSDDTRARVETFVAFAGAAT